MISGRRFFEAKTLEELTASTGRPRRRGSLSGRPCWTRAPST